MRFKYMPVLMILAAGYGWTGSDGSAESAAVMAADTSALAPANPPSSAAALKFGVTTRDSGDSLASEATDGDAQASMISSGPLDYQRVGWDYINLRVSKFFISINSSAYLSKLPAEKAIESMLSTERGQVLIPTRDVVRLDTDTRFLGRQSLINLLMDPVSGAAFQYEVHDQGGRFRHRFFRFAEDGTLVKTWRPAEEDFDEEKQRPWREWSRIEEFYNRLPEPAIGLVITDPLALLYVASSLQLAPGDEPLELFALTGDGITRIWLKPEALLELAVDFEIKGRGRCKGEAQVLQLDLSAAPLVSGDEYDFDFLGLEDDIRLYVDTTTRLPVEVSGKARIVGNARIRLREATLRAGLDCPATT